MCHSAHHPVRAACLLLQGPILEARGLRLGVVSAIAGQTRLWLVINGTQVLQGAVIPVQNWEQRLPSAVMAALASPAGMIPCALR